MIDIKCVVVGKTYRGQDFLKHFCRHCRFQDKITFKDGEMMCPNLKYYQSYKPKRDKRWWGTGIPGELAKIPDAGY